MAAIEPQKLALCRTRGDTFPHQFQLKDSAGVAIDITGYSFLLTVDPSETPTGSGANLFQLTATLTTPLTGNFEFAPSAGEADQTPSEYFYDVQMTDAGGALRTILKDTYTFTQDITK